MISYHTEKDPQQPLEVLLVSYLRICKGASSNYDVVQASKDLLQSTKSGYFIEKALEIMETTDLHHDILVLLSSLLKDIFKYDF
jgi:hypothetical protein